MARAPIPWRAPCWRVWTAWQLRGTDQCAADLRNSCVTLRHALEAARAHVLRSTRRHGEDAMSLSDIQTIVIVIMENRSFDHMLGYLSLDGIKPVEGLKGDAAWQASFANAYDGKSYPLFRIEPGAEPCSDPQHDQRSIACQINTPAPGRMGGFVESFKAYSDPVPGAPGGVRGYFDGGSVPAF